MAWSYNKLWKLLIDRKMKKTDLISFAHINTKTLACMGRDETVSMDALGKICESFDCNIEDIVTYISDK